MLAAIFFFIILGLVVHRIGRRERLLVAGVAAMMTAMYFASMKFW
jgi:hypothetical protein